MNIEEIKAGLELVSAVLPDYYLGRQRGLTDEETEFIANRADEKTLSEKMVDVTAFEDIVKPVHIWLKKTVVPMM